MEGALGLAPDVGVDVGVGGDGRSGRELRAAVRVERLLREDLARETDRVAEFLAIAFGREIVEQDAWRLPRIRRREGDAAARGRPHRAHVRLEAVLVDLVLAVVADRDRQEMVLQVGMLDAGATPDEAAGFEMIGRAEALAQQQPFEADGAHRDEILRRVQRDRLRARMLHVGLEVILQVRAHARDIRHHVDVELFERLGIADAGQEQDLRRIDRAAGHDDLAA